MDLHYLKYVRCTPPLPMGSDTMVALLGWLLWQTTGNRRTLRFGTTERQLWRFMLEIC